VRKEETDDLTVWARNLGKKAKKGDYNELGLHAKARKTDLLWSQRSRAKKERGRRVNVLKKIPCRNRMKVRKASSKKSKFRNSSGRTGSGEGGKFCKLTTKEE